MFLPNCFQNIMGNVSCEEQEEVSKRGTRKRKKKRNKGSKEKRNKKKYQIEEQGK